MFTQQKLLFQFTKAIALVVLFCFIFSCQIQGEKAVKEKAKDMATIEEEVTVVGASPILIKDATEITAQIEYYEKKFEVDIKERLFVELKKEFKELEPKFDRMGRLLGNYSVLTTPQGERLKGKDSIARFWRKEKERGVMDVNFTLKYYYVSEVTDPIEKSDPQYTIDAVGYAIIDYHLIYTKEGGILTNQTGTLILSLRHPRLCVWCA